VSDKYRGAIWCNLLDVSALKNGHHNAFFMKLAELENKQLEKQIDDDTIIDRSNLIVDKQETWKPDRAKVRKVLLAYGNVDCDLGYNQGYNFLVALMLNYIEDEEDVFWCLHKIMLEHNWRQFYTQNMPRAKIAQQKVEEMLTRGPFEKIGQLLDDMLFAVCQSISLDLIMSIYTQKVPLWIAKRCFEFFLLNGADDKCLFSLLHNILKHVYLKMVTMDERDLTRYLMSH
jgi:hypothetical protein